METTYHPKHVVLDGGPCAGKTTILSRAAQELEEKGYFPIIVPEAATMIIGSGILPGNMASALFQQFVANLQYRHEEVWREAANKLKPELRPVFLYDRAMMTGAAYLYGISGPADLDLFEHEVLLPGLGLTCEEVRARYDAVLHLVTAADGAEAHYTLANNMARSETAEQARTLDERTKSVWLGHGHLKVIGNKDEYGRSRDFEQKVTVAMKSLYAVLGIPIPIEDERKFLLEGFDRASIPVPCVDIEITQSYLVSEHDEERVRRRRSRNGCSYHHTIKREGPGGVRFETERSVTKAEYYQLLQRRDKGLRTIKKTRYCFVYKDQYLEVDVFTGDHDGLVIVEHEKTEANEATYLPKFLGPHNEVTHDPRYRNRSLASRKRTTV